MPQADRVAFIISSIGLVMPAPLAIASPTESIIILV